MIRIAITQAAFEAIAATLPLGSVGYENKTNERGERYVWLDPFAIARLRFLRGPGESYSDVILKLVETEQGHGRDPIGSYPHCRLGMAASSCECRRPKTCLHAFAVARFAWRAGLRGSR